MDAWTAPTTLPHSGKSSKTSVLLAHCVTAPLVGALVLRRVAGLLVDRVAQRSLAGGFRLVVARGRFLGGDLEEGHSNHLFVLAVQCGRLTDVILNYLVVFVNECIFKCDDTFVARIVLTDVWEVEVYNAMPDGFDQF